MANFFRRYRSHIVFIGLPFLVIVFFVPLARSVKTVLVYTNLVILEGDFRPLQFLTPEPEISRVLIFEEPGLKVQADLYLPARKKESLSAMVVFAPLVFETSKNPHIKNTAETFARAGFVVLVPDKPEEEGTTIGTMDIIFARRAYEFLRTLDEVDESKIAYFGLSYGAGPVLLAAADIEPRPDFVATFGGFIDLISEIKFALTGEYEYQDIKGQVDPEPWVHDITVQNLLSAFPDEGQLDALVANKDPEMFDQLYRAVSSDVRERIEALSPHRIVDQLDIPLYIIHSTDDIVVPYTESIKFFEMISPRTEPPIKLSLVSIFKHGEFKPMNVQNIFKEYLPSLKDSLRFIYNIIKHA